MTDCIICGGAIGDSEEFKREETSDGIATAHSSCITKLKALLANGPDTTASLPITQTEEYSILERQGDDWILIKRGISVTTTILAYLKAQSTPCEAKTIYDWLQRNEIKCSNPSEYIRKMRNRGEISILKTDGIRMIGLTETGIETLRKQLKTLTRQHESQLSATYP